MRFRYSLMVWVRDPWVDGRAKTRMSQSNGRGNFPALLLPGPPPPAFLGRRRLLVAERAEHPVNSLVTSRDLAHWGSGSCVQRCRSTGGRNSDTDNSAPLEWADCRSVRTTARLDASDDDGTWGN